MRNMNRNHLVLSQLGEYSGAVYKKNFIPKMKQKFNESSIVATRHSVLGQKNLLYQPSILGSSMGSSSSLEDEINAHGSIDPTSASFHEQSVSILIPKYQLRNQNIPIPDSFPEPKERQNQVVFQKVNKQIVSNISDTETAYRRSHYEFQQLKMLPPLVSSLKKKNSVNVVSNNIHEESGFSIDPKRIGIFNRASFQSDDDYGCLNKTPKPEYYT